jgi:hypothetical protein
MNKGTVAAAAGSVAAAAAVLAVSLATGGGGGSSFDWNSSYKAVPVARRSTFPTAPTATS